MFLSRRCLVNSKILEHHMVSLVGLKNLNRLQWLYVEVLVVFFRDKDIAVGGEKKHLKTLKRSLCFYCCEEDEVVYKI